MVQRKPFATLSFDAEHAGEYLGAAVMAFRGSLDKAVSMIAEDRGTADLSWLDELRDHSVKAAKGTLTENIPIETEAGALRFGFQMLEGEFEALRRRLIKPE